MNKLIQCEALEGLADLPPASIPLVVTSPPWGNTRLFGGHVFDFKPVASELWRVIEPGGVVCWHHQDQIENGSESCEHCHQLLLFERLGFRRHQTITVVYHKYRPTPRRYYRVASQVYVLSKKSPRNFRRLYDVRNTKAGSQMDMKLRDKDGFSRRRMFRVTQEIGYRGDVWEYLTGWMKMCEDQAAYEHGAVMHLDLARDLIRSYSRSGDLVLDVCAGTGTTGVAALMTGRQYLLFEPWDKAVGHAQRRLANAIRKICESVAS
jgi:DNA modification methylase